MFYNISTLKDFMTQAHLQTRSQAGSWLQSLCMRGLLLSLTLFCTQCSFFEEKKTNVALEEADLEGEASLIKAAEEEALTSLSLLHVPFTQEQREAIALEMVAPVRRMLHQQLSVYGKILPNEQHYAHVVTKLSGIVREVHKQRGDAVQANELLALLDSPELAESVAVYIAALHQRDVAERNLLREERLYQQQLIAENTWIQALSEAKQRKLEVAFAEQKLLSLGLTTSQVEQLPTTPPSSWRQMTLNAPLDGVVLERDLVVGEWISAQHPAFTIANLNTVWAKLEVPVIAMESIALGKTIGLYDLLSREHVMGHVIYVSPSLNKENFTVHVIAEVDNSSKKWRLDSSVEAELFMGAKEALTIPRTAIQRVEGQEVVFVEAESEAGFAVRPVEVGMCDCHFAEVLGGLNEEDRFVVDQTFILKSQLVLREEEDGS